MRRVLVTTLTAAMLVGACSAAGGTGGTIEGIRWIATSIRAEGSLQAVPQNMTVDATFAAGKVAGFGGCNTYTGPASIDGAKLTIGPVTATMMACLEPLSTVEGWYFAALGATASYTATAEKLTLFDKDGKEVVVYQPGPANPLLGAWIVDGYNDGKSGVVPPIEGTELTATFTEDGTVSGSAGCNQYNGSYTLDGDKLSIGPLTTTKMACPEPIMAQEQAFLAALQSAASVAVEADRPVLRTADDAIAVSFAK